MTDQIRGPMTPDQLADRLGRGEEWRVSAEQAVELPTYAEMPAYGSVPWEELTTAVSIATTGSPDCWRGDAAISTGHQMAGINMNSLSRIVSMFMARAALAAQAVPEGCTPADAMVLREANHALAAESNELQTALANLLDQVDEFVRENGEANFYTGEARPLLRRLRPELSASMFATIAEYKAAVKAQADQWREAVDAELAGIESTVGTYPTPREAVRALIDWHVSVALDPAVSSDARALIARGADHIPDAGKMVADKLREAAQRILTEAANANNEALRIFGIGLIDIDAIAALRAALSEPSPSQSPGRGDPVVIGCKARRATWTGRWSCEAGCNSQHGCKARAALAAHAAPVEPADEEGYSHVPPKPAGSVQATYVRTGPMPPRSVESAAPAVPVALTQEQIADIVRAHLTGVYYCGRVWEAWQVGTMTEDDFTPASEIEVADEIVAAVLAALRAQAVPAVTVADRLEVIAAVQQAALALEKLQGPGFLIGGVMHARIGLILPMLAAAIDALATPQAVPAPSLVTSIASAADREQVAFEAWLADKKPSGDVTEVQRQWEFSDALEEFLAQEPKP